MRILERPQTSTEINSTSGKLSTFQGKEIRFPGIENDLAIGVVENHSGSKVQLLITDGLQIDGDTPNHEKFDNGTTTTSNGYGLESQAQRGITPIDMGTVIFWGFNRALEDHSWQGIFEFENGAGFEVPVENIRTKEQTEGTNKNS